MPKRLLLTTIPLIIIAALLILIAIAVRNSSSDESEADNPTVSAEELLMNPDQTAVPTPQPTEPPQVAAQPQPTDPPQNNNPVNAVVEESTQPEQPAESEQETEPEQPAQSEQSSGEGPRVLAWADTESGSRLIALQNGQMPQELYVFPGITTGRIQRCSHHYRVGGDQGVILFIGQDRGDLVYYPFDGSAPITIGQTGRLTCAGPDTLQVFPDGKTIAYIEFTNGSLTAPYRSGNLILYSMEQQTRLSALDFTVDFEISGDDLLALRFYPDGEGRATEADLDIVSSGGARTAAILNPTIPDDDPDTECFFASGSIARAGNNVFVLLGQTCNPGGSTWSLLNVSLDDEGSINEIAHQEAGGGFYNEEFSTQVFASTDGSAALVAVPSGLERHIVRLIWVRTDGTTNQVADFSIADRLGDPYLEGRHLLISPESNWLAYIEVTPDGVQSLKLIDLSWPFQDSQPVMGLNKNERFEDMRWGPGGRLFTISGGVASNAVYVTIPGMSPVRLARGQFTSLEPDTDGQVIAVAGWIKHPENTAISFEQASLMDMEGNLINLWQGTANGDEVSIVGVE